MLSLVQLSLALILPGAPLTRLSGGSRVPGIVAQETRDAEKEYASSCYLPTDTRAPRRTPCPYCVTREAPSRTAFSLPARALAAPTCSPLLAGMPARATCRPTGRLVRHTGLEPRTSRAQAGHLATHASVPRLGQSRCSRSGSTTMTRRCTTSSCPQARASTSPRAHASCCSLRARTRTAPTPCAPTRPSPVTR